MPVAVKLPEMVHCFPRKISVAEADALLRSIVVMTRYTAQAVTVTEEKMDPFTEDVSRLLAVSNKGYFSSAGTDVQYEFRSRLAAETEYGMLELKLGPQVSPKDDMRKTAMARTIGQAVQAYFRTGKD